MVTRKLERAEWQSYFDSVSRHLPANEAEIEVLGLAAGDQVQASWRTLIGFALGLAGRKSWHNLAPQVSAGVGVLTSKAADDTTGFKFGTPFAFTFGAGVKYVTGGRLQLRADIRERLFRQKYPDAYYITASDNTAVLTDSPRSYWTNHGLLTAGVSILFDR